MLGCCYTRSFCLSSLSSAHCDIKCWRFSHSPSYFIFSSGHLALVSHEDPSPPHQCPITAPPHLLSLPIICIYRLAVSQSRVTWRVPGVPPSSPASVLPFLHAFHSSFLPQCLVYSNVLLFCSFILLLHHLLPCLLCSQWSFIRPFYYLVSFHLSLMSFLSSFTFSPFIPYHSLLLVMRFHPTPLLSGFLRSLSSPCLISIKLSWVKKNHLKWAVSKDFSTSSSTLV